MEWRKLTHRPLSLAETNATLRKEESRKSVTIFRGSSGQQNILTSYVRVASLSKAKPDDNAGSDKAKSMEDAIDEAIKSAFARLNDEIISDALCDGRAYTPRRSDMSGRARQFWLMRTSRTV
jgi:hypothetical protein